MLFIHQRLSKSAIVRSCLCGPNDENMVVVSFAVKTANFFGKKRVKEKGFGGEGLGVMGHVRGARVVVVVSYHW